MKADNALKLLAASRDLRLFKLLGMFDYTVIKTGPKAVNITRCLSAIADRIAPWPKEQPK